MMQLNLHHCKEAMTELCQFVANNKIDLVLLQEPYTVNGCVVGMNCLGGEVIFLNNGESNPRTCIYASNRIKSLGLIALELCRDMVAVEAIVPLVDGIKKRVVFISAYIPSETDYEPPTKELEEAVNKYRGKNVPIIIGCDANSHHVAWGSSNTNKKGELFLEFIVSNGLDIVNVGNTSTFVTKSRQEVLDITLVTGDISNYVKEWRVDLDDSFSDHRRITFHIDSRLEKVYVRNIRKTDWATFESTVSKWKPTNSSYNNIEDMELGAIELETVLTKAHNEACPKREIQLGKGQPWWSKELGKNRKKVRRALRVALKKGDDASWASYREIRTEFRYKCRKEARIGWHSFCGGIASYPESARLMKVLAKDRTCKLGSIKVGDKLESDPKLVLFKMMETHFPECQQKDHEDHPVSNTHFDFLAAEKIITEDQLQWSINSFAPYKAAGPDGIFPKMLQVTYKYIKDTMLALFQASLASGYLPYNWRKVKTVFIPKPGKKTYQEAKSFRCISLSSFILKAMEKIIDGHMRTKLDISTLPLHDNQHAYRTGKSTETALHNLVVRLERTLNNKEFALGCFFDVEGAFDKANREAIQEALHRDGIERVTECWIMNMLQNRSISAELGGETHIVKSTRGFPQGGCLSPLLWCLLLDSLITKINNMRIYMQAYSDDGVLLVTGKHLDTVRNIMSTGIRTTLRWCRDKGLNLNPSKTKLVLFTKKRKNIQLTPINIEGVELELIKEIKYLGVVIDNNLRFRTHIEEQCNKAKIALLQCRRAVGRSWGMKPHIIKWIYTAIILPRILYGAIVWWHKAATSTLKAELTKVQRMAMLMISGAIRTTPSAALEILLGLYPIDLEAKKRALGQWYRLKLLKQWKGNFMDKGHTDIGKMYEEKLSMIITNNDLIVRQRIFDKKYRVHIGSKDKWKIDTVTDNIICYTDGSRRESTKLSGAGIVYTSHPDKNQTVSLGKFTSIFQAETYAILQCAVGLMNLEGNETKEIVIYSDSQAALKALDKEVTTSALVKECKHALNSLAEKTKVTIAWVPGHQGNEGNESADELARMGASTQFHGPEPCLPIPYTITKRVIEGITERESNSRWNSSEKYRQSKLFLKSFDKKKTKQLMSQSRSNLALVVGITTGHCLLNRHLKIMKIKEDPTCPECGEEETSLHFMAECPMYSRVRWEKQGKDRLEVKDLASLSVRDIVRFTKATGRFEGGSLPGHQ